MVGSESLVSGTSGQTIGFSANGATYDFNVPAGFFGKLPDNLKLLKILFPEEGLIGRDNTEKLFYYGAHPVKMSGSKLAFHLMLQAVKTKMFGNHAFLINLCGVRGEYNYFRIEIFQEFHIPFQAPGVFLQILRIIKLGWVHKDTNYYFITGFQGSLNKG